jgi:hypothetical protein
MKWVIQDKVFGDETDALLPHLRGEVIVTSTPQPGDVVRGSVEFVLQSGGRWLTLENYRCSKYYPKIGVEMVNHGCVWAHWGELKAEGAPSRFFRRHDKLFIRPDSGAKLFTGTTITKKWWRKELEIIENLPWSKVRDDDLVLLAPFKEIVKEVRGLYFRGSLISHAAYVGVETGDESVVMQNVARYVGNWFPDGVYTIDVAFYPDGTPSILELNSFVSAGLYGMDMEKVARAVEGLV